MVRILIKNKNLLTKGFDSMQKSLNVFGGLNITIYKGYFKVVHSKGAFGWYKGQGFWNNMLKG